MKAKNRYWIIGTEQSHGDHIGEKFITVRYASYVPAITDDVCWYVHPQSYIKRDSKTLERAIKRIAKSFGVKSVYDFTGWN